MDFAVALLDKVVQELTADLGAGEHGSLNSKSECSSQFPVLSSQRSPESCDWELRTGNRELRFVVMIFRCLHRCIGEKQNGVQSGNPETSSALRSTRR